MSRSVLQQFERVSKQNTFSFFRLASNNTVVSEVTWLNWEPAAVTLHQQVMEKSLMHLLTALKCWQRHYRTFSNWIQSLKAVWNVFISLYFYSWEHQELRLPAAVTRRFQLNWSVVWFLECTHEQQMSPVNLGRMLILRLNCSEWSDHTRSALCTGVNETHTLSDLYTLQL